MYSSLLIRNPLIRNSGYKELIFIPQSLTKELVHSTFIRNSGFKEQFFMVLMSFL